MISSKSSSDSADESSEDESVGDAIFIRVLWVWKVRLISMSKVNCRTQKMRSRTGKEFGLVSTRIGHDGRFTFR